MPNFIAYHHWSFVQCSAVRGCQQLLYSATYRGYRKDCVLSRESCGDVLCSTLCNRSGGGFYFLYLDRRRNLRMIMKSIEFRCNNDLGH